MTLPTFRPAMFARGQVAMLCDPDSAVARLAVRMGARYSKRQKAFIMSREDGELLLRWLEREDRGDWAMPCGPGCSGLARRSAPQAGLNPAHPYRIS